jgi:hypothetical protein
MPRDRAMELRELKAEFFDQPPRPSIGPISERLARYVTRP